MGTANFYNKEASKVFAVDIKEDYDYDDLIENLQHELLEKGYTTLEKENTTELRSFPSVAIAEKDSSESDCIVFAEDDVYDIELSVNIKAIVTSGYYQGCNLDWRVYVTANDGDVDFSFDSIFNEIKEDMEYNSYLPNEKQIKQVKEFINSFIEKYKKEITILEDVYSNNSIKLGVVGRFSNGETIYKELE